MLRRETPFRLGHGDREIFGEVRSPGAGERFPVVIVCHSFMAFKEWGFFPHTGRKLADAGFSSITFNFSLNGAGPGARITDRDAFERNTIAQERSDLGRVIDAVARGELPSVDRGRIALLGHSRGAGIALMAAAGDNRIGALVTWAPIATFDRWTQHQKEEWRRKGYHPMAKDPVALRLGRGLLDGIEGDPELLDLTHSAGRIGIPWLIIHGRADVTVHPAEAERLHAASRGSELVLLEGTGHLFRGATYAEDGYRMLDGIIERTTTWLHQHL